MFGRRSSVVSVVGAVLLGAFGLGTAAVSAQSSSSSRVSNQSITLASQSTAASFTVLEPIRVLGAEAAVPLVGGRLQYLTVAGRHGAPAVVTAARLVVTFSPSVPGVELRIHASGTTPPLVPTLVAGPVGEPLVRSITVPVGANGQIEFRPTGAGVMLVDLVGVYVPAPSSSSSSSSSSPSSSSGVSSGRLVVSDPIFVGEVAPSTSVDLALPAAVPSDASAVVLAVTAWNAASNGSWNTADGTPAVAVGPNRVSSNEIVVRPVNGRVRLSSSVASRLALDVVGWFTGSSAPPGTDGLLVVTPLSRLLDTVSAPNPLGLGVALHARWTLETPVSTIGGVSNGSARALVARVGASSAHNGGSLSIHPAGRPRPTYGQIHAAGPGASGVVEATIPVSTRGVAAHSSGGTDLTIDVVAYFTGAPATAATPRAVNIMPAAERFPGLLHVPRIRLTTWILDDTALVDIDPAHLPESRTPNQPGNTALFGHRTSKGREFRNIDRIRVGDPIFLAVQGKIYIYSATSVEVLSPDDPRLYASSSNDQTLTLVACHPPGSVRLRIVVFARLQNVTAF